MRKRTLAFVIVCVLIGGLLSGCGDGTYHKYSVVWTDLFDTVTVFMAYAHDQTQFDGAADAVRGVLARWHAACDGYTATQGTGSLYEVNLGAGTGRVAAAPELIELLVWVRDHQSAALGRVNLALGGVLSLWHEFRLPGGALPELSALREAAKHSDFALVDIDDAGNTVYYKDASLRLDVGAVAKGFAAEQAAQALDGYAVPAFLLSVGGNVLTRGTPRDGRARWGVGVQTPDGANDAYLDVLYVTDLSVVTSGDDQRCKTVDGVRYHHLIDPDTLMPARYVRQVTVVTAHSGMADLLSTALFLMPYDEGRAYVDTLPGVEAYWVLYDGQTRFTDGLSPFLRSQGAENT